MCEAPEDSSEAAVLRGETDQVVQQEATGEGVSRAGRVQAVWPEEIVEAVWPVAIVAEAPPVVMAGAVRREVMAATVWPRATGQTTE
jgi:hypothetical protein